MSTDDSQQATTPPKQPGQRKDRLLPPIWVWCVLAVAAGLVWWRPWQGLGGTAPRNPELSFTQLTTQPGEELFAGGELGSVNLCRLCRLDFGKGAGTV